MEDSLKYYNKVSNLIFSNC